MRFPKCFLRSSAVFASVLALGLLLTPALVRSAVAAPNAPAITEPKDLAGFRMLETQIKAVLRKVLPAVVGVEVQGGAGSGVIVSEDGIVMTAGHVVVKPGLPVTFFFSDGKSAKGITLGMSVSADVGLMKITEPGKWPHAEINDNASLTPGAWCLAVGHPSGFRQGRPPVVRAGRILQKSESTIQTDCPLVGGDSGGPLLDLEGKVIGINSRIMGSTDANLHVPVKVFRDMWDRLLKSESVEPVLPSRNGADVKTPFRQVVSAANQCVVRVKCNAQEAALGTIVGPDGWILTKASELNGRITCRLRDGRELEARIVGINYKIDLAMLKIDAVNLPIIAWNPLQPNVGQWLATAGLDEDPLAVGIVSVPRLAVPPTPGVIGIQITEKDGEACIEKVVPNGPAEQAGLKVDDIILQINGEVAPSTVELRKLMRQHRPGEIIRLAIKRGKETLVLPVQMIAISSPGLDRQNQLNSMGVGVNRRSDSFSAVIQHDTVLRPIDCGGPVVDLSGRVVGVNIAHAGRTETFCLPTDVVLVSMYELMSGRLSPALLEAAGKAAAEKAVAEMKAALEKAAADKKAVEEKAAAEKKAAEAKAAAEKKIAEEKAAAEKKAAEKKSAKEKKAAEDDEKDE